LWSFSMIISKGCNEIIGCMMLLSVVCFIAVVVVDGWMENYAYCTFYTLYNGCLLKQ
jgi:hypothetical protein